MLFFLGILEMVIVTAWTKLVTRAKILASGAVTMINVLIWYSVLATIVDDITNWRLVILYAFGCAIGTVIGTYAFELLDKRERKKAKKLKASRESTLAMQKII
jgi:uncharacterized protein YebE (UPF0316 family)